MVLKMLIVSTLICCVFEKFLVRMRISLADKEIPIDNWVPSPWSHTSTPVSLYCQYQHKTGNITEYWANINELSTLIKHFIGCSQILLSLELRLCNSYQIFQKCCNSCHFVCMIWCGSVYIVIQNTLLIVKIPQKMRNVEDSVNN